MNEACLGNLEGVAYLERYAFELAETLSRDRITAIYSAGGGSSSDAWLTIRSNVLNKPILLMQQVSGAAGAAILAASRTHFQSLEEAARAMTQTSRKIHPAPELAAFHDQQYQRFIALLNEKGYIHPQRNHA